MKKIFFLILTVCICLSICIGSTSCNTNKDENKSTAPNTETEVKSEENTTKNTEAEETTAKDTEAEETTTDENVSEKVEDRSGYSVFYLDTGDDIIFLIEHNKDGLPAYVYYDEALYGECDGERRLDFSIEYTDDGLISKINEDDCYYEFEYNADRTYAYGMSYRSGVEKKVSTDEFIIIKYGENHNISSISSYEKDGDVVQFIFDESGKLSYIFENNEINEFTYDENGRLKNCVHTRVNDESYERTFEISYDGDSTLPYAYKRTVNGVVRIECKDVSFTEDGKVISATSIEYDDEDEYICQNTKNYDENGRITDYTLSEGYSSEGLESYRTELKYNNDGLIIEKLEYGEYEGEMLFAAKTVYEYDKNGNITLETRTSYNLDGSVSYENTTTYTYDENGRLLTRNNVNSGIEYEYDENGLVIKEISRHGDFVNIINYVWSFDENGRLINGGKSIYTYDENGKVSTRTEKYSDEGSGEIYEFSYDEIGRITKVKLTRKAVEWSNDIQGLISVISGMSETTYTYSSEGILTQKSVSKTDSKTGQINTTVYNYPAIS